jgi:hypothetical protein
MIQFGTYILGSKTVVFTDHQALKQVLTAPKPSGRVARWAAALMEYDFDIGHRPGAKNCLTDSLSRDPTLRSATMEIGDRDIDDLLVDVKKYLCGPDSFEEEDRSINQKNIQRRARRPQVEKRSIFEQGQQVMWKVAMRRNKMEPAMYGPYTITSWGPNNTYTIDNDD